MSQKIKKLKDPGSAITHFIGMLMAMFSALPLLIRASDSPEKVHVISLAIFALSLILLYTASTVYHTFDLTDKINRRLKKFDHMMIFILIAGTYTPICIIALRGKVGISLLIAIWGMAILGICLKAFWVYCPKWVSSVIYITMGWTCVLAFTPLMSALPSAAFGWLLAGGIIYTIGGLIYALKLPIFNNKHPNFGTHEIFHLFCLGGSICHFIFMYRFIAVMP
ncbi:hemolysin III family protein [Anaerocolumna aminovalerica]|jgi:hemolysin III|uniref:Hemolysin III n=1 Tax=Anaerocolumna aminovalerica TaxID=1527 RepID=A0A1I5I3U9_9FIRM|nr:hemolysin III family protein [Anaerocolumna aminovalerica]MBU5332994.1 hemolysin III family protein [Anaerocolumna aminovalerica]MDU6266098.1 hemolysin III family protein [Anaerocolumna aminovalerica]SFO55019.1 hemolysin III [Anaerocolumna aminovalerica]